MATSNSKPEPTKAEAFKHNIAPPSKGGNHGDGKADIKNDAPPAPSAQELAKQAADRVEDERSVREAEIKAAKKGSAVDGLNLPEKQGEVLWQTGFVVGPRDGGEKDAAFDKRWDDAETTIVSQALNVMAGPGGIRPNGYQLVRDEQAGILRLNLVSADPEHPDPSRVGGVPNADGTY